MYIRVLYYSISIQHRPFETMNGLLAVVTSTAGVLVAMQTLILLSASCYGYNIDLASPLVVSSGLPDSVAANYSFGFSIAHHQFSNGDRA